VISFRHGLWLFWALPTLAHASRPEITTSSAARAVLQQAQSQKKEAKRCIRDGLERQHTAEEKAKLARKKVSDLEAEKRQTIAELQAGYFCSKCMRAKSQIEKAEKTSFEAHLGKVKGERVAAPAGLIQQKEEEFNTKIRAARTEAEREDTNAANYQKAVAVCRRTLDLAAKIEAYAKRAMKTLAELDKKRKKWFEEAMARTRAWLDRERKRWKEMAQSQPTQPVEPPQGKSAPPTIANFRASSMKEQKEMQAQYANLPPKLRELAEWGTGTYGKGFAMTDVGRSADGQAAQILDRKRPCAPSDTKCDLFSEPYALNNLRGPGIQKFWREQKLDTLSAEEQRKKLRDFVDEKHKKEGWFGHMGSRAIDISYSQLGHDPKKAQEVIAKARAMGLCVEDETRTKRPHVHVQICAGK
jgi:hypothetical protein